MKAVQLLVMAKAPLPGKAKTRLIPVLGDVGASRLALRMLRHSLTQAKGARLAGVELCVTDPDDPVWHSPFIPSVGVRSAQGDGDLGERMSRAAERVLSTGMSVILMGTDCPDLTSHMLRIAAHCLAQSDAVVIPAADGGYVLLGLRQFDPRVFSGIAWGGSDVAEKTLAAMRALGWHCTRLPTLHDIDVPQDLSFLPEHWAEFRGERSSADTF